MDERHECALRRADEKIKSSPIYKYAEELYIYGSTARGDCNWYSDIDLFLVLRYSERHNRKLKKDIIHLKSDISGGTMEDPEVDLKVVYGHEWENSDMMFYQEVKKDGKLLWKKF